MTYRNYRVDFTSASVLSQEYDAIEKTSVCIIYKLHGLILSSERALPTERRYTLCTALKCAEGKAIQARAANRGTRVNQAIAVYESTKYIRGSSCAAPRCRRYTRLQRSLKVLPNFNIPQLTKKSSEGGGQLRNKLSVESSKQTG